MSIASRQLKIFHKTNLGLIPAEQKNVPALTKPAFLASNPLVLNSVRNRVKHLRKTILLLAFNESTRPIGHNWCVKLRKPVCKTTKPGV